MHTIDKCPMCGKDFMYHQLDTNLIRTIMSVDEVGNNEVYDIVICQECDEREEEDAFKYGTLD